MTLSSLIGSFTLPRAQSRGRSETSNVPLPGKRASAPDAGALAQFSSLQFVPGKETEHALGAQREVRERIADVLPGVVFDEEGRGAFARTGYTVSFDTGLEDYVRVVRVEITGGSAAMPPLTRLMSKTGWRLTPAAN